MSRPTPTTRLAPSPTGALHLGNARTFLVNWALARQNGQDILLRIEDLDTPRTKAGAADIAIDTLAWLGLDWDRRVADQASDLAPFADALSRLCEQGLAYPSDHTRAELEALSAPHETDHELRAPPSIRPAEMHHAFDPQRAWRFATPPGDVPFHDRFCGPTIHNPHDEVGDFLLWTKNGFPSYQLAVTVDDHRQGVTHIVRGADLLPSTSRQLLLRRALALEPEPEWLHLPLVRGADNRRLAKRHGDTRLESYRSRGVPPERIVALLARWSGTDLGPAATAREFADAFDIATMPTRDPLFRDEDHEWLLSG